MAEQRHHVRVWGAWRPLKVLARPIASETERVTAWWSPGSPFFVEALLRCDMRTGRLPSPSTLLEWTVSWVSPLAPRPWHSRNRGGLHRIVSVH